jgi:hypothetical protein
MFRAMKSWIVCAVGLLVMAGMLAGRPAGDRKAEIRAGVFDSRAVVVAYAASKKHNDFITAKKAELEKARAAGDSKKVEDLEAWGKEHQKKFHRQGFGSASVKDLLEPIKDSLPGIARAAGVQLIVSKWDLAYQSPEADLIDLTAEIVKPFLPSDKTLKTIEELKKHAPLSDDQLEEMEKSPH